jgi:uncharacterized protein YdhG (YjbR/CyaY superfamily)
MATQKMKPTTIKEYINAAPPEHQDRLFKLHTAIKEAAPEAIESLKWSMPAYSLDKILVTFALFKHHIGFYPMETALRAFSKELADYKTAAGSVQFPLNKPLPVALIKKIIRFRVKENKEGTIKWRS